MEESPIESLRPVIEFLRNWVFLKD
jgi:hypothetical protein